MPLGLPDGRGAAPQLLSVASLHALEQAWRDAGLPDPGFDGPEALQPPWRDVTRGWVDKAAIAIAHAIHGAVCLLDLDGVIIDGAIRRELLDELIAVTEAATRRSNWEGVTAPQLFAGTIGPDAGALGGALLPLHANFAPDRDLFIKEHSA
jgi:predicted NBD/HSP70 family sugar kinase